MASFIGVVHKEAGSDYGVSFPDFPGCITAGTTIDEAKDMAQEALALHFEGMVEDGHDIPEPSRLEEIMKNPDYADGVAFLVVSVIEAKSKTLRINISIPENTLFPATASPGIAALSSSSALPRRFAPEQGTGPDCARRMSVGKPAPIRRARGSAPRLLIDSAAKQQCPSRSAFLVRAASREAVEQRTKGK